MPGTACSAACDPTSAFAKFSFTGLKEISEFTNIPHV